MTYVLMKVLESAPDRYDKGIALLTRGAIGEAYDRLAAHVQPGDRVLDVGCGTGALTLRAARRGAQVVGIDVNPQMLAIARQQAQAAGLAERIDLREMGVAELDGEPSESYDVIMAGLAFSELTEDERRYALTQARRLLKPGGLLLLADETTPPGLPRRIVHLLVRLPLQAITYVLTQTTTHPVPDLPRLVQEAGFTLESVQANWLGDFVEIVARKG